MASIVNLKENPKVQDIDSLGEGDAELTKIVTDLLVEAKQLGATQAEVAANTEIGFSVQVRKGEVETIEHHRGRNLSLTVYFGHCSGSSLTSDLSPPALKTTLEKACNIARYTGEDPCSGLADTELMATHYPDLELYHPWDLTPEQAIAMATECEFLALNADKRITNSEGAAVSTHAHWQIYANTHGFLGYFPSTYHSINCTLISQQGNEMHLDSDYTCARNPDTLESIKVVAKRAAENTASRVGAKRLATRRAPVIFQADVAKGLIAHFLSAISGGNLYRRSSFLLDQLDQPVFPTFIDILERPHVRAGIGSAPFDSEGVRTHERHLISAGTLQSYLLGSYSARQLKLQSTGNANGAHNVSIVARGSEDLSSLLKTMGTGLFVTDLMGQGVNIITGDYSRGVFGYWVEQGEIQYPVQEVTIAGNLKEMFAHIVAVGNDVDLRGNIQTGSILLESIMIAGE